MNLHLRCLLLLLSIALPLNGLASALTSMQVCPQRMTAQVSAKAHDCCAHQQTVQPKPSAFKFCKYAGECYKAGSVLQVSVIQPPLLPMAHHVLPLAPVLMPLAASDSFWRPPRLLPVVS